MPGRGLGLAIALAGGSAGLPWPSVHATASPKPSIEWLAPVPPWTDWCMLSLIAKLSASILSSGTSPWLTLKNAIELPTPLSAVENETATNGNRSFRHPLGLASVAWAAEQSLCCHIWKNRWIVSPVYASYGMLGPVSWNGPGGSAAALVTRVSTTRAGRPVAPVVSSTRSSGATSLSSAA